MDALALVFLFALPAAFLAWTLRFKGVFSILAAAPVLFMLLGALIVNSDPSIDEPASSQCLDVVRNSTAVLDGNTTTTTYGVEIVCQTGEPVMHSISPEVMTVFNVCMFALVVSVAFVIIRRVTRLKEPSDD
jgi:hypothetical protein